MQGHYFDFVATETYHRPVMLMEAEQRRLARDLHDNPLQTLTALHLSIDLCGRLSSNKNSATLEGELVRPRDHREERLATMRELVMQASPDSRE
jgi:signal transduction histidine kinase